MKLKHILPIIFITVSVTYIIMAQQNTNQTTEDETVPYAEIPPYPEKYTATTVAARMVDGLGYRYYWATEGLRQEDLEYKISEDSRDARHTLEHIYGLSNTIANAPLEKPNVRSSIDHSTIPFSELRAKTLQNFKIASDALKASKRKDMKNFKIIFKRGDRQSEYPYWNMLNGPLADAIYHCGQIVSYRRASGNPINPKVSVFNGKNRE